MTGDERMARRGTRIAAASSMGTLLVLTGFLASGGDADSASTEASTTTGAAATVVATTPSSSTSTPATAAPTTAVPTTVACSSTYTVQPGDSWYLLAQEASTTVDDLLAPNGATIDTALFPGQSICLPDGATVVTTTSTVAAATPASIAPATTASIAVAPATAPAASNTSTASR